jgi:hypothetical protein
MDSVARMVYELDEAATDAQADSVGWLLGNEPLLSNHTMRLSLYCILVALATA